ncbi:hypothetical protein VHEMI00054 [[Torrubiella] hemipterigena]|uniref:Amidase domain-containing protein n=1 Tax=[Torrubiella] hemipterigena TaxID=1531966 RepID=A0A0A1SPB5_9HYPO|nr:hypothetical protein VHEMI00054 [[Torrubiella] hemipterigena]
MLSSHLWCLIGALLLSVVTAAAVTKNVPLLLDATLDELRAGLDKGAFTSAELVTAYLGRIHDVNSELHAVIMTNPDVMAIANEKDAERRSCKGKGLGPLHGIPILLKDNMGTADKMPNTAGSFALINATLATDSTVAAKLRKAGAILLGKTNLSQWANFRHNNNTGTSGWSAVGGQTVGAYFDRQDPSGSSSGSGVAVSIGLAWAALGSETAGSIIAPANFNNIVGIKPSLGLTSRHLVIPISEHQDTVGPMARTVKDAAVLLTAIAGVDSHDNYTSAIPFKSIPNYIEACNSTRLDGVRIGVVAAGDRYNLADDQGAIPAAIKTLQSLGATIVENVALPGVNMHTANYNILGTDFYTDLPKYLAQLKTNPNNIHTLEDLLNFTRTDPRENYPFYNTGSWNGPVQHKLQNSDAAFWAAYQQNVELTTTHGIDAAVKEHNLDAILDLPLMLSSFAAPAGHPVISIPAGRLPDSTPVETESAYNVTMSAPNQPYGIGFTGVRFSEYKLIRIAYALEQATMFRTKVHPRTQPKTEIKPSKRQ